jgi:uncharacterized protein YjbI with pentapeptide repeats
LRRADLSDAYLSGADLTGADLKHSVGVPTCWKRAVGISDAIKSR